MPRVLKQDLAHLSTLAFRRKQHCGPLVEKFHALRKEIAQSGHAGQIWNIYDWLLVPLSLWPIDFAGLASHLLEILESSSSSASTSSFDLKVQGSKFKVQSSSSSKVTPHSAFSILHLIDSPPPPETQAIVAEFEHHVESGRYEKMLKQAEKFDEQEKALLQDEQLAAEWTELKRLFNVKDFQNSRGVIRRRMSQERNLREGGWQFDWTDPRRRFHLFFDAFCYRWKLYGMEHDRPLLLKISINPTPHGTMIVIPRHWSLDPRRDLDWTLINRLHRSRGAKKQGPKLSPARTQKLDEAKQVKQLYQTAKKRGLKGDALHDYICTAMKRDLRSDPSWWKRLLRRR